MAPRSRSSSAPGRPGRGRATHRPGRPARAVRRTTRVADSAPAAAGTRSKGKLTGRAAVLLLVVAVLAVSYASSARAWLQQRSEVNQLTAEIAQGEAKVAALKQEKQRWQDPAYIETQARLRFGWLMPGEKGYRVIGDDGEVLSDGHSELSDPAEVQLEEQPEWWDGAWGSVEAAGKDPAVAAEEATPDRAPLEQIGGKRQPDPTNSGGGMRQPGETAGDR